jgi:hypothetical protein
LNLPKDIIVEKSQAIRPSFQFWHYLHQLSDGQKWLWQAQLAMMDASFRGSLPDPERLEIMCDLRPRKTQTHTHPHIHMHAHTHTHTNLLLVLISPAQRQTTVQSTSFLEMQASSPH